MAPDYKGEAMSAQEVGDDEGMEKALQDQRKRARAWLSEQGDGGEGHAKASWRPRKRYRAASGDVLLEMENMLRVSSFGTRSIKDFCVDPDPEKRPSPFEWPVMSFVRDSGADMLCAVGFLQRHLLAVVDDIPDISHTGWRSAIAALKKANLWGFVTVMMAVMNVPHGAWSDDMRYRQVCSGLEEKAKCESPFRDPLFQELLGEMCADLSLTDRIGDPALAEEVWDFLFADGPWRRKGKRVNSNRLCLSGRMGGLSRPGSVQPRLFASKWALNALRAIDQNLRTSRPGPALCPHTFMSCKHDERSISDPS